MASSKSNKKSGSVMAPGKPGTHAPKNVEKAQHRSEPILDSAWSDRSFSDALRSKQPASKYPPTATMSDNTYAKELIKSDTPTRRKPSIFK
jgi:hypothetical protein